MNITMGKSYKHFVRYRSSSSSDRQTEKKTDWIGKNFTFQCNLINNSDLRGDYPKYWLFEVFDVREKYKLKKRLNNFSK